MGNWGKGCVATRKQAVGPAKAEMQKHGCRLELRFPQEVSSACRLHLAAVGQETGVLEEAHGGESMPGAMGHMKKTAWFLLPQDHAGVTADIPTTSHSI